MSEGSASSQRVGERELGAAVTTRLFVPAPCPSGSLPLLLMASPQPSLLFFLKASLFCSGKDILMNRLLLAFFPVLLLIIPVFPTFYSHKLEDG